MWLVELCKFAASGILPCVVTVVILIIIVIFPITFFTNLTKDLVTMCVLKTPPTAGKKAPGG